MTEHAAICPQDATTQRDAVLGLWSRNLPEASPERYDWLYRSGVATSWLARDDQGEPIGAIGLMDRAMDVFGQACSAGQPIDLNVDRPYRLGGVALGLQRAITAQVEQGERALIYGFPNAQSEPVLRRVGYRSVAEVGRWVKPLAGEAVLPGWLGRGPLRRVAGAAAGAALRLGSRETFARRPRGARFEVTDHFDARFDRLWQTARHHASIMGQRSAAYLDWRFARCPATCHRALCLTSPHDEMLGYLVYSLREGTAHVSDFLFDQPVHLDWLLAAFARLMRQQGVRAVVTVFTGAEWVASRLARFGFRRRPSAWKMLVHANADALGLEAEDLFNPSHWYVTRADVDTDF
ncbi:MAG: GNAT family N-acetyltransferase [Pirellulales bacterium]|nr:GNAT family N-acetyltransferase [Pirellulales bacterium]